MKIDKKRRLESKTNYKKRLKLLKGGYLRLVVRKTNRYLILQVVESEDAKDKTLFSVNTKDLLKHGWPENKSGSLKSLAAAYLAGVLLGKKSKNLKQELILDTGLVPNTKGSRIYAAVNGAIDSGLIVKHDKKSFPEKERIKSNYEFFEKVKGEINK